MHCLLGPNGAGKSTLIKCVSGAVEPTSGEILFMGEPLPPGDPAGSLKRGVATIYQELDLVADLSVAESIFLAHEPRRGPLLDLDKMYRESEALLARLGHESIPVRAKVGRAAPGGAADRLDRARAVGQRAAADHGRAVRDPRRGRDRDALRRRSPAHRRGRRRRLHLASPRRDPAHRRPRHRPRRRPHDGDGLPATTPTDELVELMVGRKVEQLYPERPVGTDRVLLEVRDARRLPAVRGVSLQVHAGEVVGLGGLVGSGRTELLRLIYGLDQPDAGEVLIEGKRLRPNSPAPRDPARARARSGGPQVAGARPRLEPDEERDARRPRPLLARRCSTCGKERASAREQLRALNTVPDDPDRVVRLLSGGNQQKVVLARWLLHECRVLLLDEPTRGVDVATKAEIYRIISDLAESGLGVLVVSSELEELVAHLHAHPRHARRRDRRRGRREGRDGARAPSPRRRAHRRPRYSSRRSYDHACPDPEPGRAARSRPVKALEFQEYALAVVVVLLFIAGVDPEARDLPDLGQRPQHADPGERRRRARDRHDLRDRNGRHRPVGRLDGRGRRRLRRHPRRRRRHEQPRLHPRRDRVRDAARHRQRDRRRLRASRAVHRHARDVLDRQGARAASERQAAREPARSERRLVRRPAAVLAALVRQRPDLRDPGLGLRLPRDHDHRLDRPQPHALRALRRGGGRKPRGRAHRRRPGPADHLQRLRPVRPARRSRRPCCSARGSEALRR